MNTFEKVAEFNQEVLDIQPREKGLQNSDEAQLSMMQMREEIDEFEEGYEQRDLVKCVDACIDNIYFTMGVLYKMGITPDDFSTIFEVVHQANCAKVMGKKAERSGFESADAIKPEGWVAPEEIIKEILDV